VTLKIELTMKYFTWLVFMLFLSAAFRDDNFHKRNSCTIKNNASK